VPGGEFDFAPVIRTTPVLQAFRSGADHEDVDAGHSTPSRKRPSGPGNKKDSSPVGLIIALSLGGLLLVGGVILGGVLLGSWSNPDDTIAQSQPTEPDRSKPVPQPNPPPEPRPAPGPEESPLAENAVVGQEIGNRAPDIQGEDLDGKKFKLSDSRGKVVLLSFWGNWCPYCRSLYPYERSLVKTMDKRPFALIGVNSDSDRELLRAAVKKEELTWRSFWNDGGIGGPISNAWGVQVWPTLYLIDDRGIIRNKWAGVPPPTTDLDRAIQAVVKEAEARR
jgi:peroxiredoxin